MREESNWASRLTERVRIDTRSATADELGGQTIDWTELATVWAEVRAMAGTARERLQAGKPNAIAGYRVRLRKRDDIQADARLAWNGHLLLIHSLHEQDEILDILTYEETL